MQISSRDGEDVAARAPRRARFQKRYAPRDDARARSRPPLGHHDGRPSRATVSTNARCAVGGFGRFEPSRGGISPPRGSTTRRRGDGGSRSFRRSSHPRLLPRVHRTVHRPVRRPVQRHARRPVRRFVRERVALSSRRPRRLSRDGDRRRRRRVPVVIPGSPGRPRGTPGRRRLDVASLGDGHDLLHAPRAERRHTLDDGRGSRRFGDRDARGGAARRAGRRTGGVRGRMRPRRRFLRSRERGLVLSLRHPRVQRRHARQRRVPCAGVRVPSGHDDRDTARRARRRSDAASRFSD